MTVSAAAVITVMIVSAATIVTAFLTAFAMMMPTTMTAARQHLDGLIDLFFCSIAVFANGAHKVEHLAGQRVVGVNGNAIILNLYDSGHELMILAIRQGDDGIGVDVIVVEMTVDRENLALQFMNALRFVGTESLFWLEGKVEGVALRMIDHRLLESVEGDAKTSDELEGALRACFLLEILLAVDDGIQLILDRHELIGNFIHTLFIYICFSLQR